MSIEISLGTPLADALDAAIRPKLVEVGWGTGGSDDSQLSEFIILMLVNGKTQDDIASELSNDLLNLAPDDPVVLGFTQWLFDQIGQLGASANGQPEGGDVHPHDGDALGEMDTDMGSHDVSELNAPTGPRSMRAGNFRGGREKRMFNNINKSMDRSSDNVLHRVRQTGNERINTHARGLPAGPRLGPGRQPRNMMNNANNMNRGMMAGGGIPPGGMPGPMPGGGGGGSGPPGFPQWMPGQPSQMDVMAILEQQSQMMLELSQQMMSNGNRGYGRQRQGKSLFERTQNPRHNKDGNFRRQHNQGQNQNHNSNHGQEQGQGQIPESGQSLGDGNAEETAMAMDAGVDVLDFMIDGARAQREPPNPDDTVCKYNLYCTNKDCKFAHQSPAAPPGVSVDVADACSFGAACKNRKCVGRHPSPAARLAHQSEQDCRFFPNCQNPRCPFRHPSMPLCRNGADCTTPGCKFTHVTTKCKFNPCMNPTCAFAHEEGQQGGFKDKVWKPEGEEHVSERKFVDSEAAEEYVKPETDADAEVIV